MNHSNRMKNISADISQEEWVSALMDGEVPHLDIQLNGEQFATWATYHLISDVVRDSSLAKEPSDLFRARLAKRLAQEPIPQAQVESKQAGSLSGHGWISGGLLAASVIGIFLVINFSGFGGSTTEYLNSQIKADSSNASAQVIAQQRRAYQDYIDSHSRLLGSGPMRMNGIAQVTQ